MKRLPAFLRSGVPDPSSSITGTEGPESALIEVLTLWRFGTQVLYPVFSELGAGHRRRPAWGRSTSHSQGAAPAHFSGSLAFQKSSNWSNRCMCWWSFECNDVSSGLCLCMRNGGFCFGYYDSVRNFTRWFRYGSEHSIACKHLEVQARMRERMLLSGINMEQLLMGISNEEWTTIFRNFVVRDIRQSRRADSPRKFRPSRKLRQLTNGQRSERSLSR